MLKSVKRAGKKNSEEVEVQSAQAAGSIPRASRVLNCLSNNINTVTDIARECSYAKSTVHRVLKLLEESYIVTEDPLENRYYIGPLITKIATNPAILHEYLVRCSVAEMKRLSALYGETVSLDLLFGIQTILLYDVPSIHFFRLADRTNKEVGPTFIGASAKVLLSQLSEERIRMALRFMEIPKPTEKTVMDRNLLLNQILDVREQGYAASIGEVIPGGVCVSVPVKNYTSPVALSLIGPEFRLQHKLDEIIRETTVSAAKISTDIEEILADADKFIEKR